MDAVAGTSPAAVEVLAVLRFLAGQRGPVAATVVARELRLPRSTLYQHLRALQHEGLVVHLPEERRYALGVAAFELSSGYLRQEPLARAGARLLAALVDRIGESAHLAVLHGRDVIYLLEERAPHRPALVTDVGVRLPAHLTASGRAMLALLPRAQVRALFPDGASLAGRSERGPHTPAQLRAVLEEVRRRGHGFEDGEVTAGIASVAVAFADRTGWPQAAVTVSFPAERYPEEAWAGLAEEVRRVADELARRMGSRPPAAHAGPRPA
ncbi:IclR family transcriptional regulator [Pseudolysinimonas sp.]|uniref:IclR family transcriptional regulator n=1 Tax=Pseudolysinimonas sp. TaxID=2680009 RepID=UPI003F81C114